MATKNIEYQVAMSMYRKHQKETEELLRRTLGKYGEPKRPLSEVRKEVSRQLKGISVSHMIIEAR